MQDADTRFFCHLDTPIGRLMLAAGHDGIRAIEFPHNRHPLKRLGRWIEVDANALGHAGAGLSPDASAQAQAQAQAQTQAQAQAQSRTQVQAQAQAQSRAHPAVLPLLAAACRQLHEYFAGQRQQFTLPLAPQGTKFQQTVWQALRTIPYGQTWSYGQLARQIGKPGASRAVGAANGRNPIPIIIPCHRVIGADGSLTGFGGGLPTKIALLQLEASPPFDEHPPVPRP